MSVWSRDASRRLAAVGVAEREAVRLLAGVGDEDSEWWLWESRLLTAHLRVPVTPAEYERVPPLPPGCVIGDAGESGPLRPRTTPRR